MQTSSGSLTGCCIVSDPGTSSRGSDAPGTAATDHTAPFAGERRREPLVSAAAACCHPETRVAGQRTSFFLYVRSAATAQAWKTGHQRRTLSPERTQRHKSPPVIAHPLHRPRNRFLTVVSIEPIRGNIRLRSLSRSAQIAAFRVEKSREFLPVPFVAQDVLDGCVGKALTPRVEQSPDALRVQVLAERTLIRAEQ